MNDADVDERLSELCATKRDELLRTCLAEIGGANPSISAYANASGLLLTQGRHEEAGRLAREGLDRFGDDPTLLHNLGGALWFQGREAEAVELLERSLSMQKSERTLIFLGKIHMEAQRFDAAQECFTLALLEEETVTAYAALGELYVATGEYAKAESELRNALRLQPGNADIHAAVAQSLASQKKFAEALEECDDIIRRGVKSAHVFWLKGMCLFELGADAEAFAPLFEESHAYAEPGAARGSVLYSLGHVLEERGHFEEAALAYRRAYTEDPENEEAYVGHALLCEGPEDAIEILRRGLENRPGGAVVGLALASAFKGQGRYEEAVGVLDSVIPDDGISACTLLEMRYDVLSCLDRWEEAVAALIERARAANVIASHEAGPPEFAAVHDEMFDEYARAVGAGYEHEQASFDFIARLACVLALLICPAVEGDLGLLNERLRGLDEERAGGVIVEVEALDRRKEYDLPELFDRLGVGSAGGG